jgi:ribose 5-phosphate isomerase B
MRVVIGTDHAGFDLKAPLIEEMQALGHTVIDVGTNGPDSVDYPDYARAVAETILQGKADAGVMLCGSGVGGCVAVNKFPGIRAGLCHDTFSAHQGVEDDAVNVLCMGARVIGPALAVEVLRAFLGGKFSGLPRHQRRLNKVIEIERQYMPGAAEPKATA